MTIKIDCLGKKWKNKQKGFNEKEHTLNTVIKTGDECAKNLLWMLNLMKQNRVFG